MEYLTPEETAKYLKISLSSVYKKAELRKLPHVKIGRTLRFPKEVLDAWLKGEVSQTSRKRKNHKKTTSDLIDIDKFFGLWKGRGISGSTEYVNEQRDRFFSERK